MLMFKLILENISQVSKKKQGFPSRGNSRFKDLGARKN